MKLFDLEAALRGEPVWHINNKYFVENVTRVGTRVAFTLPNEPDNVYNVSLDGTAWPNNAPILAIGFKSRTIYVNIWDSPSNHYTKHNTLEEANRDHRGLSHKSQSSLRHKRLNPEPIPIEIQE